MISGKGYGKPGSELTWAFLNDLLKMAMGNRVNCGVNSGLSMVRSEGVGTFLRVSQTNQNSVFECMPSSTVTGAGGTWPAITPVSFTADVYQIAAGILTMVASSATIWNGLPASLAASKVCYCLLDGTGDYVVISQSCT